MLLSFQLVTRNLQLVTRVLPYDQNLRVLLIAHSGFIDFIGWVTGILKVGLSDSKKKIPIGSMIALQK